MNNYEIILIAFLVLVKLTIAFLIEKVYLDIKKWFYFENQPILFWNFSINIMNDYSVGTLPNGDMLPMQSTAFIYKTEDDEI